MKIFGKRIKECEWSDWEQFILFGIVLWEKPIKWYK